MTTKDKTIRLLDEIDDPAKLERIYWHIIMSVMY